MEDDVDKKVDPPHADPPTSPEPVHTDPPTTAAHDPRVDTLTTKVDELTTMVQDLLNKGEQDTTPVRRPWTHAGGK